MTFPQFLGKWINPAGQRVDYDHVYGYQCVDPIRQYLYECYGLGAGVSGNAIDYWNRPTPTLLTKFFKVHSQEPQQGDIVVLNSPVSPYGHITIATGNISATDYEAMEQNGGEGSGTGRGTDAIRTRYIPRSRIVGLLRPIPVPAAPTTPMITLGELTQLYQSILQRAPDTAGIQHYVGHHSYTFVQNDLLNSAEHKQLLANEAAAAAQAAQAAATAAASVQAPVMMTTVAALTPPAGAATVPSTTELYPIYTNLKTYGSVTDAQNRTNSKGEIYAGSKWYVYYRQNGVYNITQTPGVSSGTWINPADNKRVVIAPVQPTAVPASTTPVPPKVTETTADIRASFVPVDPKGSAIKCKVIQDVLVVDALGLYPSFMQPANTDVEVYGHFMAGDQCNALVKIRDKTVQDRYMLGIPVANPDDYAPYLDDSYSMIDHLKISWAYWFDKAVKFTTDAHAVLTKKT